MELVPAILIALVLFSAPGFVVAWISGLRMPWSAGISVPVSFGIFGFSGWVLGGIGVPYTPLTVALCWLVVVLLALSWRYALRRWGSHGSESSRDIGVELRSTQWILPAVGVVIGGATILLKSARWLSQSWRGMENIFQGWDVHWHASVIRFAMDNAVVSPTRMGELMNQEDFRRYYYPTGWHSGVALLADISRLTPIAAVNISSIVIPALSLPVAAAVLAWRFTHGRELLAQLAAGFAGLAIFGIPAVYWVGSYVGAWPYLAAFGMGVITMCLFMALPHQPRWSFAAVIAMLGAVQAHPSSITVIVIGVTLWWLGYRLWKPVRSRLGDLAVLAVPGAIGAALFAPQVIAGSQVASGVIEHKAGDEASVGEAWWRVITMTTRHVGEFPLWTPRFLALGALIGLAIVLIRKQFWVVPLYAVAVLLTVDVLHPLPGVLHTVVNPIAGLHYSTAHRLILFVAVIVVAAMGVGLAGLSLGIGHLIGRFVCPEPERAKKRIVLGLLVAVVAGMGLYQHASGLIKGGDRWSFISPRNSQRMIDTEDVKAFDWLAKQPRGRGGRIFGTPADGYGWMYAYNGLDSVSRHYDFPDVAQDSDTLMLYANARFIGAGVPGNLLAPNEIDIAARDMGISYFYVSGDPFWDYMEPNLAIQRDLWVKEVAKGVTPVYHQGDVAIFAVNQAFTDSELEKMLASSPSAPYLPAARSRLETLGEAAGSGPTLYDKPYFHRPDWEGFPGWDPKSQTDVYSNS